MAHPRKIKGYGWLPDLPDHRDLLYTAPTEIREALPPRVDLRPYCPPVYERVIEDSVDQDLGAMARDGIKAVAAVGAPPETDWPYDIARFAQRPPEEAYRDGEKHRIARYERLPRDLDHMKGCLASGFPLIFGFSVYESLEGEEVRRTGRLEMPAPAERVIGGHAVIAVGYMQDEQRFIVRNSWGPGFGMDGYLTMPYDYLLQRRMSADFWTIRLVN